MTSMPLLEFSCILLEKAVRVKLNYFEFSLLLMIKSSLEIGSLAVKLTNETFSRSAQSVLWLIRIFWYMVLVRNIFSSKILEMLFIFSVEITFIHFLRDFHLRKVMKKLY